MRCKGSTNNCDLDSVKEFDSASIRHAHTDLMIKEFHGIVIRYAYFVALDEVAIELYVGDNTALLNQSVLGLIQETLCAYDLWNYLHNANIHNLIHNAYAYEM